ncbi:MAG: saccharopine dehydrogenase family protein [Candidatus Margulisiibacteriota bacterium]|nr:saccharopine dehydrogenase family protein [Candidatus Margulisiibacteriota bacterium]
MSTVLIIGAGAAGRVVVKKCLMNNHIFSNIHLASRTFSKCEKINEECNSKIHIHQLDADIVEDTVKLIKKVNPSLVINMALPYQDIPIMDACLITKTNYLDTANYEPKDEAKFSYSWQWKYHERFKKENIMALLGSGFDPGVTNVFIKYAADNLFDSIEKIDIIDCNDGDHGYPFATNFNPEINIREITQKGRYFKDGKWIEIDAMSISKDIEFPEVGIRKGYLLYHEELESLVKHFPSIKQIRFWMTFSENYINHLNVLQNIGMTSIKPINFKGNEIIPLEFLKEVLPNPAEISTNYEGKTSIGCIITGIKNSKRSTKLIYNVCQHQDCHNEVQAQAVSYTTGVPAMIGAKLMLTNTWQGNGVFNMEEFNATPFMKELNTQGLPWKVIDCDQALD